MANHIYFVRHGESDSNADKVSRGAAAALTEKGKKEAQVVAERITRISVDAIVASTYDRALQTAEPIARALSLPIEASPLLIEWRRPSAHIGKSREDPVIAEEASRILRTFGKDEYVHSDEETFTEFRNRANDALTFLKEHPADRVCVVTHGIFLRALFCAVFAGPEFTGHDFDHAWHLATSNTGITYVRHQEGEGDWDRGWHVVTWNDLAHLG